jgi:hypothetical protein
MQTHIPTFGLTFLNPISIRHSLMEPASREAMHMVEAIRGAQVPDVKSE